MSAVATSNEFLESLRKSKLVSDSLIEKTLAEYGGDADDPNKLAEYLIQQKVLTSFQARSLLAGRYKGLLIGPYRILDKIGAGGMGIVYLAEHEKLARRVAIKVLPEDKTKDKLALERFYREARAAAALDHPNIVKAHDVCEHGGLHFLVMEYIDGANLQKYVDSKGTLPWKTALNIVIQACRGLQHAHERNMVHRDIKPGNILVDKAGQVKILDLGLARSFEQKKDNLTQDLSDGKDVMGSIDYISPEQAIGSPKIDIRADIYSLGATLYTLVTGKPPVEGSTAQKLLQHQLKLPPPLSDFNPEIPDAVSQIILKMLAKKPDQRFATPAEVAAALTPFVLSNSQRIPQISGNQFNSGSLRSTPQDLVLDTLPVANLLNEADTIGPSQKTTGPIAAKSLSGPLKKAKKFKKKRSREKTGSYVWIAAGVAVSLLALAGAIWLIVSLSGGGNDKPLPYAQRPGGTANPPVVPNNPPPVSPPAESPAPAPPPGSGRDVMPGTSTPSTNNPSVPSQPPPANSPDVIDTGLRNYLVVNQPLPRITGEDLDNQQFTINDLGRGKVICLVYWSFDSQPAVRSLPFFRKAVQMMRNRPFVMVGINTDKSPNTTSANLQRYEVPWRSLKDRTSAGSLAMMTLPAGGGNRWPVIFIIDHTGIVRNKQAGPITSDAEFNMFMKMLEQYVSQVR